MSLKKLLRLLLGFVLILVGIAGLILPILPGWAFLVPGLVILADYFPPVRRLVNWAKGKLAASRRRAKDGKGPDPEGPVDQAGGTGLS